MNSNYIQNLRYKMQKRVRRMGSTTNYQIYHFYLKQFISFLYRFPALLGIVENLEKRYSDSEEIAGGIFSTDASPIFSDEIKHAAVSSFLLKKAAQSEQKDIILTIGRKYILSSNFYEIIDRFHSYFVEPFYEYIDEQIDDQGLILSLLVRYKHKSEWFNRELLYDLWFHNKENGENKLCFSLAEFLYDQGLDFFIEPRSVSGRADFVSSQKSDDPLIADAKIFCPEDGRGKDYIKKGFNQLYTYTRDFNKVFGYLIIFNVSKKDLRFALPNQVQTTPFVIHNNRTIFILTIDITQYDKSASKRGQLECIEITEEELISVIKESEVSESSS